MTASTPNGTTAAGADDGAPYPTLSVENFGPISKAEIELRPLTVFVGPSNTGKSYMAILAYVLHQMFGIRRHSSMGDVFPLQSPVVNLLYRNLQQHPDRSAITGAMTSMIQERTEALTEAAKDGEAAASFSIPDQVTSLLQALFHPPSGLAGLAARYLVRYFGVGADVRTLHRAGSERPLRIALSGVREGVAGNQRYTISIGKRQMRELYHGSTLPDAKPEANNFESIGKMISNYLLHETHPRDSNFATIIWDALFRVVAATDTAMFGLQPNAAYYLPAGRTGLMHAHPAVGSALFDQAADLPSADIPELPMLSGLLSDFMRHLIPSNQYKTHEDEPAKIAMEMERAVLSGHISREPSPSNYPNFTYEDINSTLSIPLRTASSMISELAPLVLLLRERIEIGDTVIIEEPEGHLHPAAQAEVARLLVKLANAGVRVIVTTHSEWLLDQFANSIRMTALSREEREGMRDRDLTLDPRQFGAWLFSHGKAGQGSRAKELLIDTEFDGTLSDYGDVAEQMYNTWAEVGNRIADRTKS